MASTFQDKFTVQTSGRDLLEITPQLNSAIRLTEVKIGTIHVFIQHTSASLLITENVDPSVLEDLETIMSRLVIDGDNAYQHTAEGRDDMAAHARSVLTSTELTIPITHGRLALGTWQGVFLWEHRYRPHERSMVVTIRD